ncbi:hypothetical protein HII31_12918 [Pseudocercospora fuligena]|uniref:Uncharacterized protein n=1 Tax=Pseudocercospora fuligena TaxID=685502 RepID=A0A8H6R8B0_9PEZI|nr:hypothetical protein HII31_12918 [Pseudocercospora fuligena]
MSSNTMPPPPLPPYHPPTIPSPELKSHIDEALITDGYFNDYIYKKHHPQDLHAAIRYLAPRIQPMKSELVNVSNQLKLAFQSAQDSAKQAGNSQLAMSLQIQAAMSDASLHVIETVHVPPEEQLRRADSRDACLFLTKLILQIHSGEASIRGTKKKIEELGRGEVEGGFEQKVGVRRF